jgi:hypothetical protein
VACSAGAGRDTRAAACETRGVGPRLTCCSRRCACPAAWLGAATMPEARDGEARRCAAGARRPGTASRRQGDVIGLASTRRRRRWRWTPSTLRSRT